MRDPMHCCEDDLKCADLVVALKEAEHRPLLAAHFTGWEDRVEYWHVHDLDGSGPEEALGQIEKLVGELVERFAR
jgi:protein-tyrosine phosphatase